MNSHLLFRQVTAAVAAEGERKKLYENRVSTCLDSAGEVLEAVRHLASLAAEKKARAAAANGGGITSTNVKGDGLLSPSSSTSSSLGSSSASGASSASNSNSSSSQSAPRTRSLTSISLSAGLGLPATVTKSAALQIAASQLPGGSSSTASSASDEVLQQTARDLTALEAELPTVRSLKTERTALLHAASETVSQTATKPFPLQSMIGELELSRLKQSELSAAHAAMQAFLQAWPETLAQVKFKLCTRWARFSVGLSTGLYENIDHIDLLGTRLFDALGQLQKDYFTVRSRRAEFLAPSTANAGGSTSFKEELLHSSDMERYFKWLIPNLTASKDLNRFLLQMKWAGFVWKKQSSYAVGSQVGSEILEQFYQMRHNPHIIDRDEELKGLSTSPPTLGSVAAADTGVAAKSALHQLLAEARMKLKSKRRYALALPSLLFDEASIHTAINRVGTLSLVTPLDYENGHPLLNQILKIFPSLFEETSKRRSARMRKSESATNIEMDRSAGLIYIKRASNWVVYTRWNQYGKTPDKLNAYLREKLHALPQLDAELLTENAFVDHAHLEFVLSRLKQLSSAAYTRVLLHLKNEIASHTNLESNLNQVRKTQHHVLFLNYTSVAQTSAASAVGKDGSQQLLEEQSKTLDQQQETEPPAIISEQETEAQAHASVVPPLPPQCTLTSSVLVPPLPAVAFVPILAQANQFVPYISTVTPTNSSSSSAPGVAGLSTSGSSANPSLSSASSTSSLGGNSAANSNNPLPAPAVGSLPAHKMHILFCLRFLRLRTLKDRVSSLLNFQRSVERKLTFDDYSFGFEDRFQFNSEHIIRAVPHTAPAPLKTVEKMTNASSAASNSANGAAGVTAAAAAAGGISGGRKAGSDSGSSCSTIEGGPGLHTRLPRPHTHLANYLPTDYETNADSFMSFAGIERRDDSYKWRSGREKHLDEWEGEVQVDDCCGVPIVYDIALDDFAKLEQQLMEIGTYYINEHRARTTDANITQSNHSHPATKEGVYDVVDRWSLLLDLWECEAEFQLLKARLTDVYLEMYEHAITRARQRELAVRMVQLMELRPYLDIGQPVLPGQSRYFTHSYALHNKLLLQQLLFLRGVLDWQMSHEKQQSKRWDAHDWRSFLRSKKQMHDEDEKEHKSGNGSSASSTSSANKAKRPSRNIATEQAKAEFAASRKLAESSMKKISKKKNPKKNKSQQGSASVEDEDNDEDADEGDADALTESDSNDDEEPSLDLSPSLSSRTVQSDVPIDDDKTDTLLEKLTSLQIANSPSPFCRSFRVGMLDILPSVGLVVDVVKSMEATSKRLLTKCTGGGILTMMGLGQDVPSPSAPGGPRSSSNTSRPMSCFDKLLLDLAVLQHTSAAWTTHCQLKNSTLYDGSPHREILLSLEMSAVLHDPRATIAAIHSYTNSSSKDEAAQLETALQQESKDAQEKKDAELKIKLSAKQARRLKRLSNLVEIEDEEGEEEEDDEEEEEEQQEDGKGNDAGEGPDGDKKMTLDSAKKLLKGKKSSSTLTVPGAPSSSGTSDNVERAITPRSASRKSSSPLNSAHLELVVVAAQEKIRLLICINVLEAVSMTTQLLQQVFESHVLTTIYRRQAAVIGISCVRSLVDPYALAYHESSVEDSLEGKQASTFILAIMETEETLPIALKDFTKVEQHLRLDPYLFHSYDQSLLGASPAMTPGPSQLGVHSGTISPFNASDTNENSGSSSWSARTSLITLQPNGRARRFFHRPNPKLSAPPSSQIIKSLNRSQKAAKEIPNSPAPKKRRSLSLANAPSASKVEARSKEIAALVESMKNASENISSLTDFADMDANSPKAKQAQRRMAHRRSVSAGNASTITTPSMSSSVALAALRRLKPLKLPKSNLDITIELLEDPLKSGKVHRSASKPRLMPSEEKVASPIHDGGQDDFEQDLEMDPLKVGGRPRAHSLWQIPSYARVGQKVQPAVVDDSSSMLSISVSDANSSSTIASPTNKQSSASDELSPTSTNATVGGIPVSVLQANTSNSSEHHLHLARAQRRSLLEAQKSRAREKSKRARSQRVQAEREMAEEEKARRDALKAEEPKELCELWLSAFRRIVQAQVAHKHALAVSVTFHDLLSEQDDSAIEYLPPTAIYLNSSVAKLNAKAAMSLRDSDHPFFGGSSVSMRPHSPVSTVSYGTVSLPRSVASSMNVSNLGSPYGHSSSAHSSTTSPPPGLATSYDISSFNQRSTDLRVGCLTPRTFLYLDGLKKTIFDSFQSRQNFNQAQVGLTMAVAGLASAEEYENSSSSKSSLLSPSSKMHQSASNSTMSPTAGTGGQQMLWLRTKRDQDKLDGHSLHVYNLDVLNALTSHVYIIETAQIAQKCSYIHSVTLGGKELNPRALARKIGISTGSGGISFASSTDEENISPFSLSPIIAKGGHVESSTTTANAVPVTASNRPSSKYARMKALPVSGAGKKSASISGDWSDEDEEIEKAKSAAAAGLSSLSAPPVASTSDELGVDDLFVHLNTQVVETIETVASNKPAASTSSSSHSTSSNRTRKSNKNQSGGSSNKTSTSHSAASSAKPSRSSSVVSLHDHASTDAASSDGTNSSATSSVAASATTPGVGGSVSALLLPGDDDTYSSDDSSDEELEGASDLLEERDEQYILNSTSSMGRVRSNGTRVPAAQRTSTSFLFRIPRLAALLALLQDERQAILSHENMKLDLLARELMLDIFHLCHAMVLLDDMGVIAHPVNIPPPSRNGTDALSQAASENGCKAPNASAPQMFASLLASTAIAASSTFASPPTDLSAVIPLFLSDEQKLRLSVMLQRHVVINGRDAIAAAIQSAQANQNGANANLANPAEGEAADGKKKANGEEEGSNSMVNTEGSTKVVLNNARRISGLPDSFWSALITLLRVKRATLLTQLQLFVRMVHEQSVTKGLVSSARSDDYSAAASYGYHNMSSNLSDTTSETVGAKPSLSGEHLLRPSYATSAARLAMDPSRQSRVPSVLSKEYEDISARRSFDQPSVEGSARIARERMLHLSAPASRVLDPEWVLFHPFIPHRFNRNLSSTHGGPAELYQHSWIIASQPKIYRDTASVAVQSELVLQAAAAAASSTSSAGADNAGGAIQTAPKVLSAWEKDAMDQPAMELWAVQAHVASLCVNPIAGSVHLLLPTSHPIADVLWSFLPSSRATRASISTQWRRFQTQVYVTSVVRALDAPRSVQGDRAVKRAKRQAHEASLGHKPTAYGADELVMKQVQNLSYERKLGVWKKSKNGASIDLESGGGASITMVSAKEESVRQQQLESAIAASATTTTSDEAAKPKPLDIESASSESQIQIDTSAASDSTAPADANVDKTGTNPTNPALSPTAAAALASLTNPPLLNLEKDLDSMESTYLKLNNMQLFLDTSLCLIKLFDIWAVLRLQVIPTALSAGTAGRSDGNHAASGSDEARQWAYTLQLNLLSHFRSTHIAQALAYFAQDILFRIRHPKKTGSSNSMMMGSTSSSSSFNSSDVTTGTRRSRAEAFWKLLVSKVKTPGWIRQFTAYAGIGAGATGRWISSTSILAAEAAQIEHRFAHLRSHPSLVRKPFASHTSFATYALSLSHVEAEEAIRFLKQDIETLLLKQAIMALNQRAQYTLQKYARHEKGALTGGSVGASTSDFLQKVPPLHLLLLKLSPCKLSLGQLLEDPAVQQANSKKDKEEALMVPSASPSPIPGASGTISHYLYPHSHNPGAFFVVGEYELHKALNNFARNVLFYAERQYMTQLLPEIERNHRLNLSLFSMERSIFCFRNQIQFQMKQCQLAADCNILDTNYNLISGEHANLLQYVNEMKNVVRIRQKELRRKIKTEYDVAMITLLNTLHGIRKQFKKTKHFLERVIGSNIKRVKDEVMIAFLDGEFSQRSLFQLFKQHREHREERNAQLQMMRSMTVKPPVAPALHAANASSSSFGTSSQSSMTDLNKMESDNVRGSLSSGLFGKGITAHTGSATNILNPTASTASLKLDNYVSNDFMVAKNSVDMLKRSLLEKKDRFFASFQENEAAQAKKLQVHQGTLQNHSWLQQKLAILQQHEQNGIQTLTELRFLLYNAELDSENYKRLMNKLILEKKRLVSWRTDHIFRYQELKYRTSKYARLQNITNIKQARERLEFSEMELKRLGREEIAHTIHQVEAEERFERELTELENKLIDKRIEKLQAFEMMKEAIVRSQRLTTGTAAAGNNTSASASSEETERLSYHKKVWDRCLFQTHVMQQEQLCTDLEMENETLRQVIEAKAKSMEVARIQGHHSNPAGVTPSLDGPRTVAPQPVTVPIHSTLAPASRKNDSWNGPSASINSVTGVSVDGNAGEVYHSVHGFGPTSPVPPVPAALYYFDPQSGGTHTGGSFTSPFTKSMGSHFSPTNAKAAKAHPTSRELTAHLHRVAHEHLSEGLSLKGGVDDPKAALRNIDQALGIPNTPRALMMAAGLEVKAAVSPRFNATNTNTVAAAAAAAASSSNYTRLKRGSQSHAASRLVGARLHSKSLWKNIDSGLGSEVASSAGGAQMLTEEDATEMDEEEAAAIRADQEVDEAVTFPHFDMSGNTSNMISSRVSSPSDRFTPRPPSGGDEHSRPLEVESTPASRSASILQAAATPSLIDFGAIGNMDMLHWQQEVLRLTETKSSPTTAPAGASRPGAFTANSPRVYPGALSSFSTTKENAFASTGGNGPSGSFTSRPRSRVRDRFGVTTEVQDEFNPAVAAPNASSYASGSVTARPAHRAAKMLLSKPQPPETSHPSFIRPAPPARKSNATRPKEHATTISGAHSTHVVGSSSVAYSTHSHAIPSLSLFGEKPSVAQPLVIPNVAQTSGLTNPHLSSGLKAKHIHRAAIMQATHMHQIRKHNDQMLAESGSASSVESKTDSSK